MNHNSYIKLISGQTKGFWAGLVYIIFIGISKIYSAIIRLRNILYDKHIFKIHRTKAVVISIGNITAGGTGKTPLVAWLCNQIQTNLRHKTKDQRLNEYNLAILTRGYKTTQNSKLKTQNYVDEPALLAENCPDVNVVINPKRVIGASEAIGKYNSNVLIMDDGFQHRRLARNLDIIAIDATCPFGYGKIIPAGLLREPLSSLQRADATVITRCDQVPEEILEEIENNLRNIKPEFPIARSIHKAVSINTIDKRQISLDEYKNRKVFAFCGIGNPDSFIKTLKNMDYDVVGSKIFDDHYNYTDNCLADLTKQSQSSGAEIMLTTQKDFTKIRLLASAQSLPLAYLAIEIKFLSGQDKLRSLIEGTLAGKISKID
ncbi:MAG: tetraacyldisaccharide 4'-kinase [Sedimentisphaerales bacterium]|nr:tetraacyldisaccharide 4'-kinase [Sedimentisphaerales bacterium]